MEPLTIPFQRGGMAFEAKITDRTCVIRDLTVDERFNLNYKLTILEIKITTGVNAAIMVTFQIGLETSTGELVNVHRGNWNFSNEHEDLNFFIAGFGQMFMGSSINGFIKHYMPNNPRYSELTSEFKGALDTITGAYQAQNND